MISLRQEGGEKLAAYLRDVRKFQSEKIPDVEIGILPGTRFFQRRSGWPYRFAV